ncbi:restriction endonuclease subunit S [Roseovarius aestuarii]|nr:restriction endonuclease subunit S [Roseovarius aestuarii]
MTYTYGIQKLGDLADIRSGYLFKGALPEDASGDVSVVQVKDLKAGQPIGWENCARVAEGRLMNEARLRRGLVIFSAKGSRNFAWHIDDQPDFAIANSLFHVIDARSPEIDPAFLAWQINQPKAQGWIDNASAGVTVRNVKISALRDLPVVVPPIEIQLKIASYESAAAAERRALKALIQNREREMRGIAATILSGKTT